MWFIFILWFQLIPTTLRHDPGILVSQFKKHGSREKEHWIGRVVNSSWVHMTIAGEAAVQRGRKEHVVYLPIETFTGWSSNLLIMSLLKHWFDDMCNLPPNISEDI